MDEGVVSTAELLDEWRDAVRAAEPAERLARLAEASAEDADESAAASEDIAHLAERAAEAAANAAQSARNAADRTVSIAKERRDGVSRMQGIEHATRQRKPPRATNITGLKEPGPALTRVRAPSLAR
jgi:hypothetical protein